MASAYAERRADERYGKPSLLDFFADLRQTFAEH